MKAIIIARVLTEEQKDAGKLFESSKSPRKKATFEDDTSELDACRQKSPNSTIRIMTTLDTHLSSQ